MQFCVVCAEMFAEPAPQFLRQTILLVTAIIIDTIPGDGSPLQEVHQHWQHEPLEQAESDNTGQYAGNCVQVPFVNHKT